MDGLNLSTLAGIITALGVFLTAIVGIIGAVSNWRATNRVREATNHVDTRVKAVDVAVSGVHDMVNSRLTALLDRQEELIARLEEHGVPVPPRKPE